MKKTYFAVLIGLTFILSLFVSGCQSILQIDYTYDATESDTLTSENEKTYIRVQTRYAEHDATAPLFQALMKEYMTSYPDVVIVDESINEELAYNNKLKLDIASGNIPDMFQIIGHANLLQYAKNGMILNVEPMLEEDPEWAAGFSEESFNAWTFKEIEGIYGIPFSEGPEVMFYNKALFQKAGIDKPPETWQQLIDCIEALNEISVTPWGVGGKETWRIGHIHNMIMHRWNGVEKSKEIGRREAKWTDPEVVETLKIVQDLYDLGAFNRNVTTTPYLNEKTDFFAERTAMVFNGTWFIGEVKNSDIADKIGVFMFPYFEEKPEFKGDYTVYISGHQLNGRMAQAEKTAMANFQKFITSKEVQERMVYEIGRTPARKDVEIDPAQVAPIVLDALDFYQYIDVYGDDTFVFDPLPSMQDVTRNAIASVFLGASPQQAAAEIQAEIDRNTKTEN